MFRTAKSIWCGALLALVGAITPAFAGGTPSVRVFLSQSGAEQALPYTTLYGSSGSMANGQLDYALFATELFAYLAKEILPDSQDEYGRSPLGSRWTSTMPERRSDFGSHCLMIVGQIGAAMPRFSSAVALDESPSMASYAVRAASTGLALREVWRAFERDVRDDRGGVSLDPKVSSRRVGVNLTLHW